MGRPQLYTTPDDKKATNRAKSKRYYERNKAAVQERRRARYKEDVKNSRVLFLSAAAKIPPAPPKAITATSNSQRHLDHWFGRALRVKMKYSALTEGAPRDFINLLVQNLMSDKNKGPLSDTLELVTNLLRQIKHVEKEIYEVHGICPQYHQITDISRVVQELSVWLEDVLGLLLLSFSELCSAFFNNQLAYQAK
ncbi:hypothetical protein JOM56_009358 [Amanita muscaria]